MALLIIPGLKRWSRTRGPHGYFWTWNWPITARELNQPHNNVLYCIALYCIVLYCIVLYCIVLYCIVLYCIISYYMAEWFRVLWYVNSRSVSSPVRTSSSRSPFQNQNNQQSYIINILLVSFARSVRQVMDPRFFLPCFHGPRASRLGHQRKEKTRSITCRTDLTLG